MTKLAELHWKATGEGVVKFTSEFATSDRIVRLDALTDWIHDLKVEYDRMLSEGGVFDMSKKKKP